MTAPAWASSGTYLSTTTGAPSFAVPADVASGDIIAVVFFMDTQAATVTALPSGFDHADGSPVTAASPFNHSLVIAVKRASAADTGTYDFTLSGSVFVDGQAHRFTGGTASGAILDTPSGTATDSASSTTTPAVSMTTTGPDRLILHAGTCWAGGTWTAPSGYTKLQQGGAGLATLADLSQATEGSTGSITATVSNADKRAAWIGALASPATAQTVAPTGIAVPVALGSPTVSQDLAVGPAGIAVPAATGSPAVSQALTVAPSGIAVTTAVGSPRVRMAVHPAGIAVPVALGSPSVSGPVFVPPEGGNWDSLLGVLYAARADAARDAERVQHPLDCPIHGWPLQHVRGVLHCEFGGHVVS